MKQFVLATLFTIGFALPSTLLVSCCDCEAILRYFDINGIRWFNHQFELADGTTAPIAAGDEVDFDQYRGTSLLFAVDYVAVGGRLHRPFDLQLLPSALAFSCDCDETTGDLGAKDEALIQFAITTVNDFSADYPAGSEITELFEIDAAVNTGELLSNNMINLTLLEQPTSQNETQFQVNVILNNGERYDALTDPVIFR